MQVDFSARTVNLSYLLNGQNPAPPEAVWNENKESAVAPPEKTDSASDEQTVNKPPHPDLANRKVVFDIVPGSKDIVVKIVDPSTGEVVRQIPGEKFHEFAPHVSKYR